MKLFVVNNGGNSIPNIWCACISDPNPSIVAISNQHISFSIVVDSQVIYFSAIYGSTSYLQRRILWQELNDLQLNHQHPWFFIGDYNVVIGSHEYRGRGRPLQAAIDVGQL